MLKARYLTYTSEEKRCVTNWYHKHQLWKCITRELCICAKQRTVVNNLWNMVNTTPTFYRYKWRKESQRNRAYSTDRIEHIPDNKMLCAYKRLKKRCVTNWYSKNISNPPSKALFLSLYSRGQYASQSVVNVNKPSHYNLCKTEISCKHSVKQGCKKPDFLPIQVRMISKDVMNRSIHSRPTRRRI